MPAKKALQPTQPATEAPTLGDLHAEQIARIKAQCAEEISALRVEHMREVAALRAMLANAERVAYPIEEAASAVGLSRRYLDGQLAVGNLVAHKAGNKTLVKVADLEAFVESLPVIEKRSA
jgi:excisionase family DNA binding protein